MLTAAAGLQLFGTGRSKYVQCGSSYVLRPFTVRYVYLGRKLIGSQETADCPSPNADVTTTRYHHTDALGSVVARSDDTGAITDRNRYEPYGKQVALTPLQVEPGFTGHNLDQSGLIYMQARYYDPDLGRFLATDPIGIAMGNGDAFNRFSYAGNNPVRFIDPDGMLNREFNYENRELGITPPPKRDEDWLGTPLGVAMGAIVLPAAAYMAVELGVAALTNPATTAEVVTTTAEVVAGEALGPTVLTAAAAAATATRRTFQASDPLVTDLANKIEAAYPGHVVGVEVPIYRPNGELATDQDILLRNGVVEVKGHGGKGMTSQLKRIEAASGLPAIGYGPNLKPSILRSCVATNCEHSLIEVVRPDP